jgi:hypothetical protein
MAWNTKSVFGGMPSGVGNAVNPKPPSLPQLNQAVKMGGGAPYMDLGNPAGIHEAINPVTGMGRLKMAPLKQREAVMAKLRGPKV